MLKFHAHDTVNDIAVIETAFCFNVRYGLEVKKYETLAAALRGFGYAQRHALAADLDEVDA